MAGLGKAEEERVSILADRIALNAGWDQNLLADKTVDGCLKVDGGSEDAAVEPASWKYSAKPYAIKQVKIPCIS